MSPFVLRSSSSVLLGGSREVQLTGPQASLVGAVSRGVARAGAFVHVGCAKGADQLVIHSLVKGFAHSLRVFAVGFPSGMGFWGGSSFRSVQSAASAGVPVRWGAGGSPLRVGLVARLMARSVAALQGCSLAIFFYPGCGSTKVALQALKRGIPVICFCAFPPELSVPSVACSFMGLPASLYRPHS